MPYLTDSRKQPPGVSNQENPHFVDKETHAMLFRWYPAEAGFASRSEGL